MSARPGPTLEEQAELNARINAFQLPPDMQRTLDDISASISTEMTIFHQRQLRKYEFLFKSMFVGMQKSGEKQPNRAARRQAQREAKKLSKKQGQGPTDGQAKPAPAKAPS